MSETPDVITLDRPKKPATGQRSGDTVTVVLNHEHGIILDVLEEYEDHEPVMGGGTRTVKAFRRTGEQYRLNGYRTPVGTQPNYIVVGKYALTQGIPREVWEQWLSQHHDSPLVRNKLISAHAKLDKAQDEAKELNKAGFRSGLQAIRPDDDPRIEKRRTASGKLVPEIEPFKKED